MPWLAPSTISARSKPGKTWWQDDLNPIISFPLSSLYYYFFAPRRGINYRTFLFRRLLFFNPLSLKNTTNPFPPTPWGEKRGRVVLTIFSQVASVSGRFRMKGGGGWRGFFFGGGEEGTLNPICSPSPNFFYPRHHQQQRKRGSAQKKVFL